MLAEQEAPLVLVTALAAEVERALLVLPVLVLLAETAVLEHKLR
jgi:hypothetical protein